MRLMYSVFLLLAVPVILLRLLWRGRRQPGYWHHVGERFGLYRFAPLARTVWLHAVSVGEVRATHSLVTKMRANFPGRPILITCMTPTGRETAEELYGSAPEVTFAYLPYDFATLHGRLIGHVRPSILLVMETEIWPNLFAACRARNVPVWLVNARLSERSLKGYCRVPPVRMLIRAALAGLRGVAAQTPADAQRLRVLGAPRVVVTGNVKFDAVPDSALIGTGLEWRASLSPKRQVLLAASTREGEEQLLLEAYSRQFSADRRASLLLVLVPRHPQRFDQVAALAQDFSLRTQRRSSGEPVWAGTEVWLGDSMGEMAAYMAMCDIAFIGGSLVPMGGQNLIEACAQGKPVLMGPSVFNFADAARLALEAGAMRQADSAAGVMSLAATLFEDAAERATRSTAAGEFAKAHAGASERLFALLSSDLQRAD